MLKLGGSLGRVLVIGVFVIGLVGCVLTVAAARTQHGYYVAVRDQMVGLGKRLSRRPAPSARCPSAASVKQARQQRGRLVHPFERRPSRVRRTGELGGGLAVTGRREDDQLVHTAGRGHGILLVRGPAVREQYHDAAGRAGTRERLGAGLQRAGESGDAVSPQSEHPLDDHAWCRGLVQPAQRPDVPGEGEHRMLARRAQGAGRGDHGGRSEAGAGHRPRVVDEQTQRELGTAPVARDEFVEVGGPALGPRPHHRLEGRIEIQVPPAVGRHPARAPDAPLQAATRPHPVEDEARGEPAGVCAQLLVGRVRQLGEQGERGVRVLPERLGQRVLVQLADLGRDLREAGVAGQFGPPGGAPVGTAVPPTLLLLAARRRRAQASPGVGSDPSVSDSPDGSRPNTDS